MASACLATCLIVLAPAFSDASSLFLRQGSRSKVLARAFAGLRNSPDSTARTLLALDTNRDGRIDPDEIAVFAHSQGLDAEAATQEFSSIDSNGDGVLDSAELQKILGVSQSTNLATAGQAEQVVAEPPLAVASVSKDGEIEHDTPHAIPAKEAASPALVASRDNSLAIGASSNELISEDSRKSVQTAARKVAEELALEETEETQAREFDRKAAEVRANSTALAKSTAQDAFSAGAKAAHAKTNELMAKITKLEDEAQKAEVRAAALKAKSKLEMEQGNELMAVAQQALKQA